MKNPKALSELKLPAVGQVGIIVSDMERAVARYSDLMQIRPWYRAGLVKKEIYYRDRPIELDLDILVGYSKGLQYELIQVIQGEENIYSHLINTRGQGIHHLGFMVSGIEKKMEILKRAGLKCLQHGRLETKGGAVTRFAYYDTLEELGYIMELIQTSFMGIPVGMSKNMVCLGALMGDAKRL